MLVVARGAFSLEGALFAGAEPTGPYDFSNYRGFGNSHSLRLTARPVAGVEVSGSWAEVLEGDDHHGVQTLINGAIRHERAFTGGVGYALVEASRRTTAGDPDGEYFSILGEGSLRLSRHTPYARLELATRPEYERTGAAGTKDFFRYDHGDHSIGATRWLIASAGYQYALRTGLAALSPFVEVQHHGAREERGGIDPDALFGQGSFWMASVGVKIHLGGPPMRMGRYGILDPMLCAPSRAAVTRQADISIDPRGR
jgi:hypothetical protein